MFGLSLSKVRPVVLVAAGAAVAAMLAVAPAAQAAEAVSSAPGYAGDAYGTTASIGTTVTSGKSALITFGCGTPSGFHKTNSVASVALGTTLSTGLVTTSADTTAGPVQTVTTATTENLSLLNGLVTATAVKSVSTVTQGTPGFLTSSDGTAVAGLKIAGLPVVVGAGPNTRVDVPGVGYLVLNEQTRFVGSRSATLTVNGLHLVVNQANLLGFAVGTDVLVSHARSSLTPPTSGFLSGISYGSQVKVGTLLSSGPSFPAYMPCGGTSGQVRSNTGAGINVPGVLTSGTIVDTALGSVSATTATGQMTSTVESANLLNGLVTATGIKAVANAARTGGVTALDDTGSTFASITVNGQSLVVADIAPNTQINVAGVGTLYLRRNIKTASQTQIEVRMIELVITQAGVAGLPVGSSVQVAVARVRAF